MSDLPDDGYEATALKAPPPSDPPNPLNEQTDEQLALRHGAGLLANANRSRIIRQFGSDMGQEAFSNATPLFDPTDSLYSATEADAIAKLQNREPSVAERMGIPRFAEGVGAGIEFAGKGLEQLADGGIPTGIVGRALGPSGPILRDGPTGLIGQGLGALGLSKEWADHKPEPIPDYVEAPKFVGDVGAAISGSGKSLREAQPPNPIPSYKDAKSFAEFGEYLANGVAQGLGSSVGYMAGGMVAGVPGVVLSGWSSGLGQMRQAFEQERDKLIASSNDARSMGLGIAADRLAQAAAKLDPKAQADAVFVTGSVIGAMDSLVPTSLFGNAVVGHEVKKLAAQYVMRRVVAGMLSDGVKESATESAQQVAQVIAIARAKGATSAADYAQALNDDIDEIIDNGLMGFATGTVFGGVHGAHEIAGERARLRDAVTRGQGLMGTAKQQVATAGEQATAPAQPDANIFAPPAPPEITAPPEATLAEPPPEAAPAPVDPGPLPVPELETRRQEIATQEQAATQRLADIETELGQMQRESYVADNLSEAEQQARQAEQISFDDVRDALPLDDNGDPNMTAVTQELARFGRRSWAELTPSEALDVASKLAPEAVAKAAEQSAVDTGKLAALTKEAERLRAERQSLLKERGALRQKATEAQAKQAQAEAVARATPALDAHLAQGGLLTRSALAGLGLPETDLTHALDAKVAKGELRQTARGEYRPVVVKPGETPRAADIRQTISALAQQMAPILPKGTKIRSFAELKDIPQFANTLKDQNGQVVSRASGNVVDAFHADGVIYLASYALDQGRGRLSHEALHLLVQAGVITPQEMALLAERGRKTGAFPAEMEARYREDYSQRFPASELQSRLDEEAAAHLIEARVNGTDYGKRLNAIVDRIVDWLKKLGNKLRGKGYQTVNDVVDAFLTGEMANRVHPAELVGPQGRYPGEDTVMHAISNGSDRATGQSQRRDLDLHTIGPDWLPPYLDKREPWRQQELDRLDQTAKAVDPSGKYIDRATTWAIENHIRGSFRDFRHLLSSSEPLYRVEQIGDSYRVKGPGSSSSAASLEDANKEVARRGQNDDIMRAALRHAEKRMVEFAEHNNPEHVKTLVNRWVYHGSYDSLKPGDVFVDPAFMSTTKDHSGLAGDGGGQSVLRILQWTGLDIEASEFIRHTSLNIGEREVLLPPGRKFEVKDIKTNEHGLRIISLDETAAQPMFAMSNRDVDQLGFYSKALEAARSLKQAKGTPEQMLAQLKSAGVKDTELQATGLDRLFQAAVQDNGAVTLPTAQGAGDRTNASGSKSGRLNQITKAEIISRLEANRVGLNESVRAGVEGFPTFRPVGPNGPAKWSSHSLDPSNPTYREVVIHLPESNVARRQELSDALQVLHHAKYADPAHEGLPGYEPGRTVKDQQAAIIAERNSLIEGFHSGHFPEPNIIGHLMTSMTSHEGRPVYTIDQIQSDWGQHLRDKGVRDEAKLAELKKKADEAHDRVVELQWKAKPYIDEYLNSLPADHKSREDWTRLTNQVGASRFDEIPPGYVRSFLARIKKLDPTGLPTDLNVAIAERDRLEAEYITASGASSGHPLVNTTDQWTNTTLRRAIRLAAEADAEYIAIPAGDTVLTYNPGDENGMRQFYGSVQTEKHIMGIVPKNLQKLLEKIDKDAAKPTYTAKLKTPTYGMKGEGFTLFPLTDAVKRSVLDEGQPMFAMGDLAARNDAALIDDIGLNEPHPGRIMGFHGTGADFVDKFDAEKSKDIGTHLGTLEQATRFGGRVSDEIVARIRKATERRVPAPDYSAVLETQKKITAAFNERHALETNWKRWLGLTDKQRISELQKSIDAMVRERDQLYYDYISHRDEQNAISEVEKKRIFPVVLDASNPKELPDLERWRPDDMMDHLGIKGDDRTAIESLPNDKLAYAAIREWMIGKGYDAIRYKNKFEGAGWSYIAIKPGTVRNAITGDPMFAFGGERSRTADLNALSDAKKMAEEGTNRDAIWKQTGWFRGVDGKWRYEIDDSRAQLTPEAAAIFSKGGKLPGLGVADDILPHEALYQSYPTLAEGPANVYRGDGRGAFTDTGVITVSARGPSEGRSIMLHELQHGVQAEEDTARGGSPRQFAKGEIDAERARLNAVRDNGWTSVGTFAGETTDQGIAHGLYNRLAGEVEARAVQKRMNLSPEERRARPPWYDYDVPEDQQIVRTGSGPSSSEPMFAMGEEQKKRAEAMGFDTSRVLYHGTNQPLQEFDASRLGSVTRSNSSKLGIFFTDSPEVAGAYADNAARNVVSNVADYEAKSAALQKESDRLEKIAQRSNKPADWDRYEAAAAAWEAHETGAIQEGDVGQNIIPVYLRMRNPVELDAQGQSAMSFDVAGIVKDAAAKGHDGVIIRNLIDTPSMNDSTVATHYVVFDPKNIRSINAEFDPSKADSPNLMFAMGEQNDQSIKSLQSIVSDMAADLGLTIRQGLSRTALGRAAARAGLGGVYDPATGVIRVRSMADARAVAGAAGGAIQHRIGAPLDAVIAAHADELLLPPAPTTPAPTFNATGFSGLALSGAMQARVQQAALLLTQASAAQATGNTADAARLQAQADVATSGLRRRLGDATAAAVLKDTLGGLKSITPTDQMALLTVGDMEVFNSPSRIRARLDGMPELPHAVKAFILSGRSVAEMRANARAVALEAMDPERIRTALVAFGQTQKTGGDLARMLDAVGMRERIDLMGDGSAATTAAAEAYVRKLVSDVVVRQFEPPVIPALLDVAMFNPGAIRLQTRIAERFTGAVPVADEVDPAPTKPALDAAFQRWFGLYLTNPDAAYAEAPFLAEDTGALIAREDPILSAKLESTQEAIQVAAEADPIAMVEAMIQDGTKPTFWQRFDRDRQQFGLGGALSIRLNQLYHVGIDRQNGFTSAVWELHDIYARNTGQRVDLTAADNPAKLMRLAPHSHAWATRDMERGVRNYLTNEIEGPGLIAALVTALGPDRGTARDMAVGSRYRQFSAYLVARYAPVEWGRFRDGQKELPPTALPVGAATPDQAIAHYAKAKAALEAKFPEFVQAGDQVSEFEFHLLKLQRDAGLIKPETFDELSQDKNYVPFYRVFDEDEASSRTLGGSGASPILKRRRGSERDVIDPIASIAQKTFETRQLIATNDVKRKLLSFAESAGPGGGTIAERISPKQLSAMGIDVQRLLESAARDAGADARDTAELLDIAHTALGNDAIATYYTQRTIQAGRERIVFFWEKGEQQAMLLGNGERGHQLAAQMHDVLNTFGKTHFDALTNLMAIPAQFKRLTITTHPEFALANIIRDAVVAFVYDKRAIPILTQIRGIFDVTVGADYVNKFYATAGMMGGEATSALDKLRTERDTRALIERGYRVKVFDSFANFMDALKEITEVRHWLDRASGALVGGIAGASAGGPLGLMIGAPLGAVAGGKALVKLGEVSETATRARLWKHAYDGAIANGLDEVAAAQEAAFWAHDYTDYSRHGSKMEAWGRVIQFLNANLQGNDAHLRRLLGKSDQGYVNFNPKHAGIGAVAGAGIGAILGGPVGMVGGAAAGAMAKSAALPILYPLYRMGMLGFDLNTLTPKQREVLGNSAWSWAMVTLGLGSLTAAIALMGDDDEEIKETNDQIKANHWLMRMNDTLVRIPKGFETNWFAQLIERWIMEGRKGNPRWFEHYVEDMWQTWKPPMTPAGIEVAGSLAGVNISIDNLSAKPIIPPSIKNQDLRARDQFDAYSSEFSKWLGAKWETSPLIIDNTMQNLGTSWARTFADLNMPGLPWYNPAKPAKGLEEEFILRRFLWKVGRNSEAGQAIRQVMGGEDPIKMLWDRFAQPASKLAVAGKTYLKFMEKAGGPDLASATDYLQTLTPYERGYAVLEGSYRGGEAGKVRLLHPMNRADELGKITLKMEKEIVMGELLSGRKGTKAGQKELPMAPSEKAAARDLLTQYRMMETHNALVLTGETGWAGRPLFKTEPVLQQLRLAAPNAAKELLARADKAGIVAPAAIAAAWPTVKQRLEDPRWVDWVRTGRLAQTRFMFSDVLARAQTAKLGGGTRAAVTEPAPPLEMAQ